MSFLRFVGFGLRSARRRLGLVLLVYLAALVPALAVAALAALEMGPQLAGSLFARQALAGNRFGVWSDLTQSPESGWGVVVAAAWVAVPLVALLQVLVAAGVVESLLFREHRREHPFLLGVGRHGWRFVRSAVWYCLALLPVAALAGAISGLAGDRAAELGDPRIQMAGWGAAALVGLLLFLVVDLAYDLSRLAAASHGEGRTLAGFFRALLHTLRHPLRLAPLWLAFALPAVALHLGFLALRAAWSPGTGWEIALLVLAQQVPFLAAAFLRVGLWGSEIAYFQGLGEPHWAGRRRRRVARAEPVASPEPAAAPGAEVREEPGPGAAPPLPTQS
ncbi:MAG TPA: hypothetical protein VHQ65_06550 [Thermoanaerobaculia bacterium]|nr:hypothetical protein [Thermoanaerobaculia bacterium]